MCQSCNRTRPLINVVVSSHVLYEELGKKNESSPDRMSVNLYIF